MKLIWNKKVVRTLSLIMCCVLLLIGSVQIVWAMGLTEEEKVEMQDEIAMVEPYEMNVVLSLLGVQGWNRPPYSLDEVESMEQWGEQPDEPLGKYSAELLEEYIEGNIEVEIDYFYEYKSSGRRWLIQVIQIYIDGEQKYFKWYAWGPSAVEGVWSISGSGWTERVPKSVEHTGEDADETVVSDNISVEEKKHPNVSYRGECKLYKETIENVLIEFFSIREEKDLYKLADLPLTEEFFKECLADFPYGEESAEEISEIWINARGIAQDGTCMGLVNVSTDKEKRIPSQSHFKSYYVVMELKNEQIDSMEIKLVGKYPNTTITKLGDGCARKEVEFD